MIHNVECVNYKIDKMRISKKLKKFIENQKWVYAKTYADTWPHEYIVQEDVDHSSFSELANFIDTHGSEEFFYQTKQKYFKYNGWVYWHMDNIINRCTEENTYRYKKLHDLLPKDND